MRPTHSIPYRADIDGLRALAVASVVAYHAAPGLVPGGFTGVDIFFVISGFLISTIILTEKATGRFSLLDFYIRRVRRLFPALILVLAATALIGWLLLLPNEFRQLGRHIVAGAAYFINFRLNKEAGYFDTEAGEKPLLHLWSLAIEEQFYIVWPVLLLLIASRRHILIALVAITVLSFASNLATIGRHPEAAFYLPQNRFFELSIGALLAFFRLNAGPMRGPAIAAGIGRLVQGGTFPASLVSLAGLGLIAAGLALLDHETRYPGAYALIPTLGTAAVIGAGEGAFPNRLLLAARPMVAIGLVSYPLYLWHWPLLSFLHIVDDDRPGARAVAVAAAIVLASLTYLLIERPLARVPGRRLPAGLMAGTLAFSAVGLAIGAGIIQPRLSGPIFQDVAVAADDWDFPGRLVRDERADGLLVHRAGTGHPKTLFLGDSNIQQYWPRIERLVADGRAGGEIIFATSGGCPPIPGITERNHPDCAEFGAKGAALAADPAIGTVVIGAQWNGYFYRSDYEMPGEGEARIAEGTPGFERALMSLEAMIAELKRDGRRIYLVLNIPTWGRDARRLTRAITGEVTLNEVRLERRRFDRGWLPVRKRLVELAARTGAIVIDPLQSLCADKTCPGLDGEGRLIYKDRTHLRASYVREHAGFIDEVMTGAR
ncbi:MAG: acyltransferase family protein [Hyphomicrobiaceae bacterium]